MSAVLTPADAAPAGRSPWRDARQRFLRHRAAVLTLKLVNGPNGEALTETSFTILTPGGDGIRVLIGAFPSLVLAEGEYVAIARHAGVTYQANFKVQSGLDRDVEIVAQ